MRPSDGVMSANDGSIKALLADHPKMTGVLFTMLLLLSQTGVAAANGSASMGP